MQSMANKKLQELEGHKAAKACGTFLDDPLSLPFHSVFNAAESQPPGPPAFSQKDLFLHGNDAH